MVLPALGFIAGGAGMLTGILGSGQRPDERRALGLAKDAAFGGQPSHAERLSRSLANQVGRQNMAMAAAAPGTNPNLAMRNAAQANQQMGAQVAAQGGALRAQEMATARQQYAGLAQQAGAQARQRSAAISQGLGALGGGLVGYASGGQGAGPGGAPAASWTQNPGGEYAMPQGNDPLGRIMGRMPGAFTSDERLKSAIHNAGFQVDEFLDHLENKRFTLNGQSDKPPTTGVMAQDLQQSQIGREMVQQGPSGALQVDSNRALQAALASVARLNSRVRQLEGGGPRVEIGQAEIEPPMQVDIGEAQIERPRGQVPAHLRTRGVGPSGTPVALDSADHLPPVFARPPTGRGVVGGALARISHNPIPESTIRDAQLLTRVPDSGGSFRNRTPGVPAPAPTIPAAVPGPVRLEPMMQDPSARRELRDLDRNSPELLQRVANGQMGEGDMTYLSRIAPAIASRIMGRR